MINIGNWSNNMTASTWHCCHCNFLRTHTHPHSHTYTHSHTHTHIHTPSLTHKHIHTDRQPHTHTYTGTHTQTHRDTPATAATALFFGHTTSELSITSTQAFSHNYRHTQTKSQREHTRRQTQRDRQIHTVGDTQPTHKQKYIFLSPCFSFCFEHCVRGNYFRILANL